MAYCCVHLVRFVYTWFAFPFARPSDNFVCDRFPDRSTLLKNGSRFLVGQGQTWAEETTAFYPTPSPPRSQGNRCVRNLCRRVPNKYLKGSPQTLIKRGLLAANTSFG